MVNPILTTSVSVGFETLRTNPLRTILSTLGIVIGVAALVSVLSVGDGMERLARDQIGRTTDLQRIAVTPRMFRIIDGTPFPQPNPVKFSTADAVASRAGRILRVLEHDRGWIGARGDDRRHDTALGIGHRHAAVRAAVGGFVGPFDRAASLTVTAPTIEGVGTTRNRIEAWSATRFGPGWKDRVSVVSDETRLGQATKALLLFNAAAFAITAIMRHVANAPVRAWLSASTVVTAIGASVAIGLIFGLYPALRAARLSPIDAIHHE